MKHKLQTTYNKFKAYLPYVLSLVALMIAAVYLYRNADRYQQLLNVSPLLLLSLLGLIVSFIFVKGCINYLLFRGLGVTLTLNEGIGLATINTLANQLPFAGGMVAKGVYLKQRYQLAYTHFLSATLVLYVWFVTANGALGLTVLGYWFFTNTIRIPILLSIMFLGMMSSICLLWVPISTSLVSGTWGKRLMQLDQGRRVLSGNLELIGQTVALQVITTLLFAGRFWIAFHILSQNISLEQCILFASANVLTTLITITPGGLGVREGIVAGIASILGFDLGVSVIAVSIDRAVATATIAIVGAVYTYALSKKAIPLETDLASVQHSDSKPGDGVTATS